MEKGNTMTNKENSAERKFWKLFLWIVPTLFLILLAGFVVIRIYLAPIDDSSEISQLLGLSMLMVFIAVVLVVMVVRFQYLDIRYIQLPLWRWMASGFKGEPKLPFPRFSWTTKSARAEAKSKMNKKQRACIWFGNTCATVGVILTINDVVWRWIFTIKGENHFGSVPYILLWIGLFFLFAGVCISGLVYKRTLKTGDLQSKA